MTMVVKIMSGEDAPDTDSRKLFRLFSNVEFFEPVRHDDGRVGLLLGFEGDRDGADEEEIGPAEFSVDGNVYVMTPQGKTIASFGVAPLSHLAYVHIYQKQGEYPRSYALVQDQCYTLATLRERFRAEPGTKLFYRRDPADPWTPVWETASLDITKDMDFLIKKEKHEGPSGREFQPLGDNERFAPEMVCVPIAWHVPGPADGFPRSIGLLDGELYDRAALMTKLGIRENAQKYYLLWAEEGDEPAWLVDEGIVGRAGCNQRLTVKSASPKA